MVKRGHRVVAIVVAGIVAIAGASWAESTGESNAPGDDGETSPGYVVVLTDGSVVPAKSKPVSAFGSLRYVDTTGRTRVLGVSKVDLDATRKINAQVPDDPSAGTFSVLSGAGFSQPEPVITGDDDKGEDKPAPPRSITVYSATWCPYCKPLKRYLTDNGIPATIIEVDTLPESQQAQHRAAMKRFTGRVAFPTVVIDGEAKTGFSPSWIQAKLKR
jgi:glutaredoxin-like protein NrdH